MPRKVLHVVGARPNFMKIAPIMRAMDRFPDQFSQTLVHTGQHYDPQMSRVFFEELEIPQPHLNLYVGSDTHATQTAKIMLAFEAAVKDIQPHLVMVVGDVNSTLACTLTCAKMGIRVGHVEAGLRSFDRTMPEEINRVLTDQIADLLFTPSRDADANLLHEGSSRESIYFVGNVMIDSLVHLLPQAEMSTIEARLGLRPEGYVLVTMHRPSNVDDPTTLRTIIKALVSLADLLPVVFPMHARTRQHVIEFGLEELLTGHPRLRVLEPLGYIDFLALMRRATIVLTDSGGVQEETTYLGVPCLTVRPNTERNLTIELGTNQLVQPDCDSILQAATAVLQGARRSRTIPEYWDGHAAERIVQVLLDHGIG